MSDIKTVISVVDKSTPAIRKISSELERLYRSFDVLNGSLKSTSSNLTNALNRIDSKGVRALTSNINSLEKAFTRLGATANTYKHSVNTIKNASNSINNFTNKLNASIDRLSANIARLNAKNINARTYNNYIPSGRGSRSSTAVVDGASRGYWRTKENPQTLTEWLDTNKLREIFVPAIGTIYTVKNIVKPMIDSIAEGFQTHNALKNSFGIFAQKNDILNQQQMGNMLYQLASDSATRTHTRVTDYGRLLNSLLINKSDVLNPIQANRVAETATKAFSLSSPAPQELQGALYQFSQVLSSGKFQGDEFKIIQKNTPEFLRTLIDGLQKVDEKFKNLDVSKFKEMTKAGEVSATDLVLALEKMSDEVDARFAQIPVSFSHVGAELQNTLGKVFLSLGKNGASLNLLFRKLQEMVAKINTPEGMRKLVALMDVLINSTTGAINTIFGFLDVLAMLQIKFNALNILISAFASYTLSRLLVNSLFSVAQGLALVASATMKVTGATAVASGSIGKLAGAVAGLSGHLRVAIIAGATLVGVMNALNNSASKGIVVPNIEGKIESIKGVVANQAAGNLVALSKGNAASLRNNLKGVIYASALEKAGVNGVNPKSFLGINTGSRLTNIGIGFFGALSDIGAKQGGGIYGKSYLDKNNIELGKLKFSAGTAVDFYGALLKESANGKSIKITDDSTKKALMGMLKQTDPNWSKLTQNEVGVIAKNISQNMNKMLGGKTYEEFLGTDLGGGKSFLSTKVGQETLSNLKRDLRKITINSGVGVYDNSSLERLKQSLVIANDNPDITDSAKMKNIKQILDIQKQQWANQGVKEVYKQRWGDAFLEKDLGKIGKAIIEDQYTNFDLNNPYIQGLKNDLAKLKPTPVGGGGGSVGTLNVGTANVGKQTVNKQIDDEELKLLRDISAKEFLFNISKTEPVTNITFGDVRETADLNQLIDELAKIMRERVSSSLLIQKGVKK